VTLAHRSTQWRARTSVRGVLSTLVAVTALCGISTTTGSVAHAQATDKVAAEALFQQARTLMDQGKYEQACPKLEESQRQDPAVGTLLYLGLCYEKNGQTASAWATYHSAESAARNAGQSKRAKMAQDRAENLTDQLSTLTIRVPASSQTPGLTVKRDGKFVGTAMLGTAVPVDPGEHTLEASAPGKETWTGTVEVPGNAAMAAVDIPVLKDAPKGAEPAPAESGTAAPSGASMAASAGGGHGGDRQPGATGRGDTQRIIGIVSGVVGVVGGGIGVVFALRSKSKDDESTSHCGIGGDPNACDDLGLQLNDEAKQAATISTVSFVAGAAFLAGGAVLYLTAPSDEPEGTAIRVAPALGPRAQGLLVQGTF
jgi:hypothetical protein